MNSTTYLNQNPIQFHNLSTNEVNYYIEFVPPTIFGIFFNFLCSFAIIKYTPWTNSTFLLIISLSICDNIMNIVILAPWFSPLFNEDSFFHYIPFYLGQFGWFAGCLHLILMAINRAVAVLKPNHFKV